MKPAIDDGRDDLLADPFGENTSRLRRKTFRILGSSFEFESDSPELLQLADHAFAGLPAHQLPGDPTRCRIRLALRPPQRHQLDFGADLPPLSLHAGAGFLYGAMDSCTCVMLAPDSRAGLVLTAHEMLKFPYHLRYELIEFAVFTLAARVRQLVPLHAACIGRGGLGALLLGPSGAGKSTLSAQCLLHGLDFVSEDSVFVQPDSMLATGVANFLHLRADSLHLIEDSAQRRSIGRSPVIRRRSGVEKLEVDLRGGPYHLARKPVALKALIFVSPESADASSVLTALSVPQIRARMRQTQAYAASQPGWRAFQHRMAGVPGYELRRARHPRAAVDAITRLLA